MTLPLDSQLPAVGTRINYASNLGTVRFVGPVDGTTGIWLGVEWDDPRRGKHDGSKDGKQYFTCTVPNSGSFVRPIPSIIFGRSFLDALSAKYVETPSETRVEKIVLGSSGGAIEVEAVGMNKIRNKLSRIETLREVSLDMENVAYADPPGQIRSKASNIKGLDLSRSLIPSWETIFSIISELFLLETLSLNFNRFQLPSHPLGQAFIHVHDLRLNGTLTTWEQMLQLLPAFPALMHLELGFNNLQNLTIPAENHAQQLTTLNLESNQLQDWQNILTSVAVFPRIGRLILSENLIKDISPPPSHSLKVPHIKHLALASNGLRAWSDADALHAWFPDLMSLNINDNPIVKETSSRPLIIARLPTLITLNASAISPAERRDSELFYLSSIVREGPQSEQTRELQFPRYRELCEKHGKPEERQDIQIETLGNRLVEAHFFRLTTPTTSLADLPPPTFTLRILPTMTLRLLCLKVLKTLKAIPRTKIRMWLLLERHGTHELVEFDMELASRSIDWWGVEDGCKIAFCIE